MSEPAYQKLSAGEPSSAALTPTRSRAGSPMSSARPATYYGDGPFDPPSSDSEDDDGAESNSLLEKPAGPSSPELAELGRAFPSSEFRNETKNKRGGSLRFLAVLLAGVLAFAVVIGIIAAVTYSEVSVLRPGSKKITMDHMFNGTFRVERKSVNWVPEAGDGVFSLFEDNAIKLVDLKTNSTRILAYRLDITDETGNPIFWSSWKISPDLKYILLKADYRKQWRWSSFGNYYIHNIEQKTTHPIIPPTYPANTAYATWSPTGQSIAFVTENDLYILTSPSPSTLPIRVTASGNASLFHGVPDWVYEEEVFSADSALWWSPDSQKLAFLKFDETNVDEYAFPVYNPTEDNDAVVPYTREVVMKYPKPGYENPLVTVHVFDLGRYLDSGSGGFFGDGDEDGAGVSDFPHGGETYELDWRGRRAANESVILEVAWVGNASLVVKEVNRNADDGNVVLFDFGGEDVGGRVLGRVVRKLGKGGEEGDSGWIDNKQSVRRLPENLAVGGYLDIVPTKEGYDHIALFSPVNSSTPYFLTSGKWEVTRGIRGIDAQKGVVYFEAAKPSSIERHIYSVLLPKGIPFDVVEPTAITDVTTPSYYMTKFSPGAGYYLLNYEGPSIPWQKLVQVGNSSFDYYLTHNERLTNVTMEYEAPTVVHSTITSDGHELNVQEIRPPRMDDSGRVKYPVLFRVYGGPQSQTVDLKYGRTWHDYLACGLSYIIVIADGRGTGFKGRELRNPVKDNLGFYETIDQINVAKIWAAKVYVDRKRIGIWGWSYGGFMASKVVEARAGVHTLAMAVAPVTSWRLYDSIYTERYMNLPEMNPGGYVNASISNVTGFRDVDFLLAHGSADDNVHYANSAHLLDMFTKAGIRNFRFRMFTDSDHSISRRGGFRELYEFMTVFLVEKWGKGGRQRGW